MWLFRSTPSAPLKPAAIPQTIDAEVVVSACRQVELRRAIHGLDTVLASSALQLFFSEIWFYGQRDFGLLIDWMADYLLELYPALTKHYQERGYTVNFKVEVRSTEGPQGEHIWQPVTWYITPPTPEQFTALRERTSGTVRFLIVVSK